jgi:HK97 family phage portal protein
MIFISKTLEYLAKSFRAFRGKSYNYANSQNYVYPGTKESFIDFLLARGFHQLAAKQTIDYYTRCAPLSDSIDRISQELASLTPVLENTKTGEIIRKHPVLDLLDFPNADSTWDEFMTSISSFFAITGEFFVITSGDISRPPIAIFPTSPAVVSITPGSDGYPEDIIVGSAYDQETFTRNVEAFLSLRRYKFYNTDNNREIYQVKNFNPNAGISSLRGSSVLNSIYYEIEQCISSGIHNLSLLKRGGTLSGILSTNEDLSMMTDDQREKLKEQINDYFSGENNTGRIGFFDKGITYQQMTQTNRDMNFAELKAAIEKSIYNRFKIPLPLVSTDSMAEANVENARMIFYDNTVIPLANRIFAELTQALMYRYKNSEDLIITFDIDAVPALQPRRNQELLKKKELEVFSINELRTAAGADKAEQGDDILRPSNLIPVARVTEEN